MTRHEIAYAEVLRLLYLCSTLRDRNPERARVSQLEHAIQTADRARQAGADDELVIVALVHDAAKPLSEIRHGEIIAQVMREYVSPARFHILRTHGRFQADLTGATHRYGHRRWCEDALLLAGWDSASFEPGYRARLSTFTPLLRSFFTEA